MNRAAVAVSWLVALLGGLASLQSDTPDSVNDTVKPYRFVWWMWSYEVFALLVTLGALIVDIRACKVLVCCLLTIATSQLISGPVVSTVPLELLLYKAAALPGSNGAETRGLTAAAGIIICLIGNFCVIMSTALIPSQPETAAPAPKTVV